jgi:hypothetical protein
MQMEMGKNPPNFPVFPLNEHYPQGSAAQPLYAPGLIPDAFNNNSPAKGFRNLVRYMARRFHQVFFLDLPAGVADGSGKISIVRKQNQSRGPVV